MPESRKRKFTPKNKPSEVPASQRVRGRIIWSLLLAVFGVIIAFFAVGSDYLTLTIGALIGAIAGYFIGIQMVRDLSEK